MSKRKTITFSDYMVDEILEICRVKNLTFQAFIVTAADEKVRRERDDYKRKEESKNAGNDGKNRM